MPIGAWYSAAQSKVIDLGDEHLMEGEVPPQYLEALLENEQADTRHQGSNMTVTGGLGCVRRTFLERTMPCITDPQKVVGMTLGTGLHGVLGGWTAKSKHFKNWLTEGRDNGKCSIKFTLFGIEMDGKMDIHKVTDEELVIWDWKTSMSGFEKKSEDMADQHNAAQLNMYRLGHAQVFGPRPRNKMVIWNVGKTFVRQECAIMSEEEIGRVRPGSNMNGQADTTVRENFAMLSGAFKRWEAGETAEKVAESLPFSGLTHWISKRNKTTGCDGCAVAQTCRQVALGGVL